MVHLARRQFRHCAAGYLDSLELDLEGERDIICECATATCVADFLDRQRARAPLGEEDDSLEVAELREQIDACLMARAMDSEAYVELASRSAEEICACTSRECLRGALAARGDVVGRMYVAREARETAGPHDARACDCVNRFARDQVADPGVVSLIASVFLGEVSPHRRPRYERAGGLRCTGERSQLPAHCRARLQSTAPIEWRDASLVVPTTEFRWAAPEAWRAAGQFSGEAEWRAVRGECGARSAVLLRVTDEARDVWEHLVEDWSSAHTLASCSASPPTSLSLASSQLRVLAGSVRFESSYTHDGESYRVSVVRTEGSCGRVAHLIGVSRGGPDPAL